MSILNDLNSTDFDASSQKGNLMRVMYRMFQVGFAALILTPVVGAVQVAAPQVQLTIEPAATLFRGRTEVLEIRVKIPDGYFIPAETSGPLKGAWLQSDTERGSAARRRRPGIGIFRRHRDSPAGPDIGRDEWSAAVRSTIRIPFV
jgi:hypothetical protein